jgi:hypothetical protein
MTFQTVLSAPCSSTMTPVAPTSSVAMPITVAITPVPRRLALTSMVCTIDAASSPSSPLSCSTIFPWAASGPSTRPATAITTSSTGASAKTV